MLHAIEPLANCTNQQAWAMLLLPETWERACPRRHAAASGALAQLIRLYIAIEDGECTVERDLGELRAQILEHNCCHLDVAADHLMIRLCGPRTLTDITADVENPLVQLTLFARECASLWRQIYGDRIISQPLVSVIAE